MGQIPSGKAFEMFSIESLLQLMQKSVPLLATLIVVIGLLTGINALLKRRWKNQPSAQFRFQMIMLLLTLAGILAIIIALPISNDMQAQILQLIGILLSAAIALSSTTFIGNIMAGIMLRTIRSCRPGDFITLGDVTGRITEMDLLHTEVQTEFRDLVTVPNLNMVTQPMKVVRASGTIISAEVSLGFDVPCSRVFELLIAATKEARLKDGFAHVRELGDFSVSYRVAGLLEDVTSLISARSALRVAMLHQLHQAGIEIVSPTFMNTRALEDGKAIMPATTRRSRKEQTAAEEVVFDKADVAAKVEELRKAIEATDKQLAETDAESIGRAALEKERERLIEKLSAAEEERDANSDE
ncbi:MAG: mechanosensitive ion channel [Woeseiaceae bacterium]|nr:mechanosensitive ion channel [Woeseiaceae bacterium]